MNKVILMGRLTREPEVRVSNGENAVTIAHYTLAVDRRGAKRDQNTGETTADFIRCVAFGKAAEFAERYFMRGMRVLIAGRIQTGSYQNREGQTVYTTDVIIEEQHFADSKGEMGTAPQPSGSTANDGFMNLPDNVSDEGLPFN